MTMPYWAYVFALACAFLSGYYWRKEEELRRTEREQRERAERAAQFYYVHDDDDLATVVTIDAKAIIAPKERT